MPLMHALWKELVYPWMAIYQLETVNYKRDANLSHRQSLVRRLVSGFQKAAATKKRFL